MAIQDRNTIRNWFLRGLKPTQTQFWDTWDSFWHKLDKISIDAIEGLGKMLNNKAEVSQLDAHVNNTNNPHKITIEQVGGAQEALESKANKDHKHSIEEIPDLREELDAIGSGENLATANLEQTDWSRTYKVRGSLSIEDGMEIKIKGNNEACLEIYEKAISLIGPTVEVPYSSTGTIRIDEDIRITRGNSSNVIFSGGNNATETGVFL